MKPKTLILMTVAISCGLGASYMTSRLLSERHEEVEKVRILVAKRQLNMGDSIKLPHDMFEEREYIKDQEPRDAIVKFDDVKGRVLKKGLRPGDFVRVDDLVDSRDLGLPGGLPYGYRAMGQRVSPESSVRGFILPYSRVDVIQTVRRGDDGIARIVLQNVLVLAVGHETAPREGGGPMLADVVTLAVSPEDALKLHLARENGTISFILRKTGDNGPSPTTSVGMHQLNAPNTPAVVESEPVEPTQLVPALPPLDPATAKTPPEAKDPNHNLLIIEGRHLYEYTYSRDARGRFQRESSRTQVTPQPAITAD